MLPFSPEEQALVDTRLDAENIAGLPLSSPDVAPDRAHNMVNVECRNLVDPRARSAFTQLSLDSESQLSSG